MSQVEFVYHLSVSTFFMPLFIDFLKNILFIYLREKEHKCGEGAEGEGEADSPWGREPDAGLNPRTLRQ